MRTLGIWPTTCPVRDGPADRASLVRYLTIAGDRAFDAAAFDDAVGHFEHALSLIPVSDQLRSSRAAGAAGDGAYAASAAGTTPCAR